MLIIRPLTKVQKIITLLSGMTVSAVMVIIGFPEPPPGIAGVELLLLLWIASIVIWAVFMLVLDILAKAQKQTHAKGDEGHDGPT